jgi:hypothetical protein
MPFAFPSESVFAFVGIRNLAAENRILRAKLPSKLRLTGPERATLAEIGKRLGRKALRGVAGVTKPDTILAWYRRLVAEKFDGSRYRQYPGRPKVAPVVEWYRALDTPRPCRPRQSARRLRTSRILCPRGPP